jgi:hypothetical protein
VSYSFDDGVAATGPDTYAVFQNARGSVRLSRAFRLSGYRAVEIRDVPGDGDFPELQGYFPARRDGWLVVHFALLVTDPAQELNVALAGPAGFQLGKDAIAFWLQTRDGVLYHVSDSIPRRLLALAPFTWYGIDLDYDVASGLYDLRVVEEGRATPVVDLRRQANAASQPGSAVGMFSFVGDVATDRSAVVFYVDDVLVGSNREAALPPFVAPGRRRLFFDYLSDYRRRVDGRACLPSLELDDFGAHERLLSRLKAAGRLEHLAAAVAGDGAAGEDDDVELRTIRAGAQAWREGCAAQERDDAAAARRAFRRAAAALPGSLLYRLSEIGAAAAAGDLAAADVALQGLATAARADPRYPLVAARLAARRGDLGEAQAWLERPAAASDAPPALCEQYYLLLMWREQYEEARRYAAAMTARLAAAPAAAWIERAADAAFAQRDLAGAAALYQRALGATAAPAPILLKLADVHFLRGDLEAEKALREKIYGSLAEN